MLNYIKDRRNQISIGVIIVVFAFVVALQMRRVIEIPEVTESGIINIQIYGICIVAAIVTCVYLLDKNRPKELKDIDIWEALIWILVPGIFLARAWHVMTDFHLYQDNLLGIFEIWKGGTGSFGAISGGLIGGILYLKINKLTGKVKLAANYVFVFIPLGQAIGRLGNLFSQELFGPPTNLPWGVYIRPENRPTEYLTSEFFHPSFLYEMLGTITLFVVLYYVYNKFQINGLTRRLDVFALYLVGYGIIRFVVEFWRLSDDWLWTFSFSQVVAVLMVISGSIYLVKYRLVKLSSRAESRDSTI